MADLRLFANTSNLVSFVLKHSTTVQGLTGLSSASSGLIISTRCDNEATATAYTVAGSTIETITTLGTFAAPTATKCRFKEVDATNHKGLYEFQFADARFAVASSRQMVISVTGAANLLDTDYEIQLVRFDPYSATNLGLTNLDATVSSRASQASVDTIDDFLDTEIATLITNVATILAAVDTEIGAIKAKTDNLPVDPADASDIATSFGSIVSTLATIAGYIDTEVAAIKAKTDQLTFTTPNQIDADVINKTGYKLAADGLDTISTTAPIGVASNFREMLVQTWRRFFRKSTLTITELKTYADDGSTVLTTQLVSDDSTTQTQGTSS